jgi:hypothetical protein
MRPVFVVACAALALAPASPGAGGLPLPAGPGAPAAPPPARALPDNCRWFMVEAADMMASRSGAEQLVALCRRASRCGYNGLLLWDSNLWNHDLPDGYLDTAAALMAGLAALRFTLVIEMCPRGVTLQRWSGDPTIVEPRPHDPHPLERDYRYLCLSHPGVLPIWEAQVKRAEEIYHPLGWLLQYDELRVACCDERCRASGKSPGQLLAEHGRAAIEMCRRVSPGSVVAVWNDMFDPHHNARRKPYFHVAAGFEGAWDAIDRDVLILDFNDKMESFAYWSGRGNRQIIAGYFDGELGLKQEGDLVREARRHHGVIGWMYTTWDGNFSALESYGAMSGYGSPAATPALIGR